METLYTEVAKTLHTQTSTYEYIYVIFRVVHFIGRDPVLCVMKSGIGAANECVPSFINEHRLCHSSITGFSPPRPRCSPKLGHAETEVRKVSPEQGFN